MCAIIKNPLQRDGTSQEDRLAKILLPGNARIDDRSIEEIIAFAARYAGLIRYYNSDNQPDGDWSCFYKNDPCILLALLATVDTDSIACSFKNWEEKIEDYFKNKANQPVDECEVDPLPGYYDALINLIFKIAERIQTSCKGLPEGHLLKEEIITLIKNDLRKAIFDNKQQDALIKLIGYDKASLEPVNDYTPFISTADNQHCSCTTAWQLDREKYDCIYPDNLFDLQKLKDLFYIFFAVLVRIKSRAKIYFEKCIEQNDAHQPHVTLFLTFLYLFQYAIDHLNTLTGSHLRYYYEKVLCLHKKKETQDRVHIIFELAKNFHTHLVEEGSLLNAGKDAGGKLMVYALMEEIVVNKTKVEELKTIYISEASGAVYAAPQANTKDGLGEKFNKEEEAHWQPLGNISIPDTETGFALASPMFFLSEGLRTAMISYHLASTPQANLLDDQIFRAFYTSGKEWIEIENVFDALDRIITKFGLQMPDKYKDRIKKHIDEAIDAVKEAYARLYHSDESNNASQAATKEDTGRKRKTTKRKTAKEERAQERITEQNVVHSLHIDALRDKISAVLETAIREGTTAAGTEEEDDQKIVSQLITARNEILSLKHVYVNRQGPVYKVEPDSQDPNAVQKTLLRNDLDFLILTNFSAPPFTPLETDEKKPDIHSAWPMIKTLVRNRIDENGALSSAYNTIKELQITGVDIKVAAYGMKDLAVQNDTAILDNSKEIQPFSSRPYAGSNFYFGNREVFQKKLDVLGLELEWAGRPDFSSYYNGYVLDTGIIVSNTNHLITNDYFNVDIEVLHNGRFQKLSEEPKILFNGNSAKRTLVAGRIKPAGDGQVPADDSLHIAAVNPGNSLGNFQLNDFSRNPYINDFTDYNVTTQRGFARLNLKQDFLHDEYPKSLLHLTVGAKGPLDPTALLNEPYTPRLKNTSLFYISSERTVFGAGDVNAGIEQLYHVLPFGYLSQPLEAKNLIKLLPQFLKTTNGAQSDVVTIDNGTQNPFFTQGTLYIGLKDAEPEQKVNILFQILEGSGDNRFAPPDIEWSYLVNNTWYTFTAAEIQDHTRADESSRKSLLQSGIIEFSLPKTITSKQTTLLNKNLFWIRAVAHEDANTPADSNLQPGIQKIAALPELVAVIAQAGIAEFKNGNNILTHLGTSLPAQKISKFVDSRAAIKSVAQPFHSFDGRLPENDNQFYRRISERLRHKNRAVCIWDYERLVLEQFPQVHKVKCLNHTGIIVKNGTQAIPEYAFREIAPGFVTVSVIPDLRNRNAVNKLEPRVPVGMLEEIRLFLKKRSNLFVASPYTDLLNYLQVLNPLYETIKITCCVRFYQGVDVAYYRYVLNNDLKQYLSPWAFDSNREINFGSTLHKSAILNFIEERKYVDVVLGFEARHIKDGIAVPSADPDLIIPTTSRSILTSYNTIDPGMDLEHNITHVVYEKANPCPPCMTISDNN